MMQNSGPKSSLLPKGTVDTHFHLFGPEHIYPYTLGRSYTPEDACLESYLLLAETLGISRGVLVQPSVYGTDNRRLLAGMAESPLDMRGVVVVDATIQDADLEAMHRQGVRAIRINLVFKAGEAIATAIKLAPRLRALGWHIQFLVDVSTWHDMRTTISGLGVPVVFDHIGHVPAGHSVKNSGFTDLLNLMQDGLAWVKLSGAYRMTQSAGMPPYPDVRPFFEAAIAANATQIVWATDWPHSALHTAMPDDRDLINMALSWIGPDESLRRAIFIENPERLYGFAPL